MASGLPCRRGPRPAAGALCLCALVLAGCGGPRGATRPDPLFGDKLPVPAASAGAPSVGAAARNPLPALPAPSASTATAALANGTTQNLDTGPGLRIPGGGAVADKGSRDTPGVTLSRPQPVTDDGPPPVTPILQPIAPVTYAGGAAVIQSTDQAVQVLEGHGMKGFRLELDRASGQWRCICSIPNRQDPRFKRTYDARAADRLAAVRAVVEQVERENP